MPLHDYSRDFIARCTEEQDAHSVLRYLCEEIGPRLSASNEESIATEYAVSAFARCGYESHIEEFRYSGWLAGESRAVIHDRGAAQEVSSRPLGWCPGGAVTAPVVDVGFGTEQEFGDPGLEGEVEGKIALVSSGTKDGDKPLHRSEKYRFAVDAGAAGFLLYHEKPGGLVPMGAVNLETEIGPIPAIGISYEDAMHIRDRGGDCTLELSSACQGIEATSHNGIGFKRGRQSGEIVVCGHIDTWFCQGARDNGSGVAMMLELARLLEPYELERGIRFITFGSEELGLHGSKAYVRAHEDLSRVFCVLNLDCSATRESALTVTTNENQRLNRFFSDLGADLVAELTRQAASEHVAELAEPGKDLQIKLELKDKITLYSDHYPFREKGVPAVALLTESPAYSFSHTEYDTLDKVTPESFTFPLVVAGVFLIECATRAELRL